MSALIMRFRRIFESDDLSGFVKRSGLSAGISVAGTSLAFVLQVVLARVLVHEEFGIYVYMLAWINLAGLVAKFGFDVSALKYLPAYHHNGDASLFLGFVRFGRWSVLAISLVCALLFLGGAFFLGGYVADNMVAALFVAPLLLPVNALIQIESAYLFALREIVVSRAPVQVLRPLILSAILIAGYFLASYRPSAEVALLMTFGVGLVIYAVLFVFSHIAISNKVAAGARRYDARIWMASSFSMAFVTSANMFLAQADLIIVGLMLGTDAAGIYAVASRVATFVMFPLNTVNMVVAPTISTKLAQGDVNGLRRIIKLGAWFSVMATVPLCLVLVVAGEFVLRLFGPHFVEGATVLSLLAISRVVNGLTAMSGYLMSMSGHEKELARALGYSAIANVVLNVALIPVLGMAGAAVATIVASAWWGVAMSIRARAVTGVNPTVFSRSS